MKNRLFFIALICFVLLLGLFSLTANTHAKTETALTQAQQQQILFYTRAHYENKKALLFPEVANLKNALIMYAFDEQGSIVAQIKQHDTKQTLQEKIHKATSLLKEKKHTDPLYIHIMLVSYKTRFANFGIKGLFDYKVYEPQVTGIAYELHGKRAELTPLDALRLNLGAKGARTYLAKNVGINPKDMIKYNDLIIEMYRVLHFGEAFPDHKFTTFHRGQETITTSDVTYSEMQNRLKLIGQWYENNVKNNEVTYEYYPAKDLYQDNTRTMVRSTMAVWVLNKLAFYLNDPKLKQLGQETLNYYLERYFNMTRSLKTGELQPTLNPTKKGEIPKYRYTTAGFMIMSFLERGEFAEHKKEIALLADWLMKHQRPDGIFTTQYAQSQYFMPGQLLLAMASLYEETKDKKYKAYFDKSFLAYKKQLEAMMHLGNQRYAPFAPAWFTQPLTKMWLITKENKYRELIFTINDRASKWYQANAQDQVYFDYDGMLAPIPGSYGNTAITAAVLESLVDAAYVAKISGDSTRLQKYASIIKKTTAYLMRLQYTPANTYYIKNRERVIGGFKTDLLNTKIWMDNVWHLTSAFIKIEKDLLLP
ncbi:MAG: hypothetical protein ABII18_13185 [bacterium]|nr:hypothetical protein [bacterium]MBU1918388.1 hypothetical protein [bacterium]